MSGHTPGPWSWVRADGECAFLRYQHPDGGGLYVLSPEADVSDYGLSVRTSLDVSNADAALIAAAPDLLEALVKLVAIYDDEFGIVAPEMNAAIAAIAKATTTP